jgi:hypothetical protein
MPPPPKEDTGPGGFGIGVENIWRGVKNLNPFKEAPIPMLDPATGKEQDPYDSGR